MRAAVLVSVIVLVISSCGDDGPPPEPATLAEACTITPGCGEALADTSGPRETIFRVTAIQSGEGEVSFGTIDRVDVLTAVGISPGPGRGDLLLVGRDATGTLVDGQLIAFPRFELLGQGGEIPTHTVDSLEGQTVSVVGYLRALPDLAEIALIDPTGADAAVTAPPMADASDGTGSSASALSVPAYCAHVRLIESDADREGIAGSAGSAPFVEPRAIHQAAVEAALARFPPLLCKSVSRIVLVSTGAAGRVNTAHQGDVIGMNVLSFLLQTRSENLKFQETLIHEATHSATALLDTEASASTADFGGQWDPDWRSEARATLENTRLERGLVDEWERMNESFVAQGWARSLPGALENFAMGLLPDDLADLLALSEEEIVLGGSMSRYGSTLLEDDIAEMVALTIMGPEYRAVESTAATDLACQAMQRYGGTGVPSRFSAVYSKLHFLKDLGLLTEAQVDACTGPVMLAESSPGFVFRREGEADSSYSGDVAAGISTDATTTFFHLDATGTLTTEGMSEPATVRLELPLAPAGTPIEEVSWPRGVYPLSEAGGAPCMDYSGATLELATEDLGYAFDFTLGFVLVAEASNDRIAGSIFTTQADRFAGGVCTPDVLDPPYVIRFEISN